MRELQNETTFKITAPHDPSLGWHQWWFPNGWRDIGPVERRDRGGKRQGSRAGYFPEWFVLACNNPECPGRAVVIVSALTNLADEQDPAATPAHHGAPASEGGGEA